jgi:hypothetical protein
LALIVFIFRIYKRLQVSERFVAEDYFILLAWILLLSNAILWSVESDNLFLGTSIATGGTHTIPPNIADVMNAYFRSLLAMYIITNSGLWCVKVSLLFFFKRFGRRKRTQRILWWCATVFIAASFVACIGIQGYSCLTAPFPRSIGMETSMRK